MTHRNTVRETYGAALRLGAVTPGPEDLVVAVGPDAPARPGWTQSDADARAARALAPPRGLRFDLDRACDRLAPAEAWEAVDYDSRYRTFLDSDPTARTELDRIRRRLATGGTVWLVCPGNTAIERRHRAVVVEVLEEGLR